MYTQSMSLEQQASAPVASADEQQRLDAF